MLWSHLLFLSHKYLSKLLTVNKVSDLADQFLSKKKYFLSSTINKICNGFHFILEFFPEFLDYKRMFHDILDV